MVGVNMCVWLCGCLCACVCLCVYDIEPETFMHLLSSMLYEKRCVGVWVGADLSHNHG